MMELGLANQNVFADTLLELARQDRDVLVVTSDSRGSGKLVSFGEALPAQIVEVRHRRAKFGGCFSGPCLGGQKGFRGVACLFCHNPLVGTDQE